MPEVPVPVPVPVPTPVTSNQAIFILETSINGLVGIPEGWELKEDNLTALADGRVVAVLKRKKN
jgi:hypothetical protein